MSALTHNHPQLAQLIKAARKDKKLSQYDFGKGVKSHVRTVCAWENGEQRPSKESFARIVNFLSQPATTEEPLQHVSLDEMLAEIDRRGFDVTISSKKDR